MIIFSFLLEGLISNYISFPFFLTLTALIFYSNISNEENVIRYGLIIGVLYDITYTNTLFLNSILFFLIVIFLQNIDKKYKNKLSYFLLINVLIHICYIMITYLILILFRYFEFQIIFILKVIIEAILIDTIYFLILYFINHKIRYHT